MGQETFASGAGLGTGSEVCEVSRTAVAPGACDQACDQAWDVGSGVEGGRKRVQDFRGGVVGMG